MRVYRKKLRIFKSNKMSENDGARIALLIPSLSTGGMERVMSGLAGYFSVHKHAEVHLVLYGIKREIFYTLPKEVVIHRPDFPFDNSKRLFSTLKTLRFIRKTVRKINPVSVLNFGEYWNNFVLLALSGTGFPVFVSDRCQPDKSLGWLHDRLRRFLYRHAAGIIAQTEKAEQIYAKQFAHRNIEVIGNPIRRIPATADEKRENIVLSVGRLISSKHHDMLIDIFASIPSEGWKLVILGGDALRQNNMARLTAKVRNMHLEDKVFLMGNVSNVDEWYVKSKIFAFTSSSEGFPNVIGEAMSAGTVPVAFDCIAGPSDMITDGKNGYLIPLFDKERFAEKLSFLMRNDEVRKKMSSESCADIEEFSETNIGERFYKFILSV